MTDNALADFTLVKYPNEPNKPSVRLAKAFLTTQDELRAARQRLAELELSEEERGLLAALRDEFCAEGVRLADFNYMSDAIALLDRLARRA